MNKKFSVAAIGVAMFGLASVADAGISLPSGLGKLQDDNIEYVLSLQPDGSYVPVTPKAADFNFADDYMLKVGDRLRTVIQLDQVLYGEGPLIDQQHQDLTGAQELTGISEIQIASITPGGPGSGTLGFAPSADFAAEFGLAPGAVVALWEQAAGDFDVSCHTLGIAACETAASNGNKWLVAGFGDPDDYWFASGAALNVDVAFSQAASTGIGQVNYGLSVLENYSGYKLLQQSCFGLAIATLGAVCNGDDSQVDLVGSGSLLGGQGLTNNYFARSDFDFQLNRVPAPAPLGLLGLGLVALGLSRRKS